jgi:hypothetical protein
MLPGIGRLGAGNCTIFSQQRQDFFNRATSMTFICAAIMSRISLASSPTRRSSPPQSGQTLPGSISLRSRTAFSDTRGRLRITFSLEGSVDASGTISSSSSIGLVLFSDAAINKSSSASSNCWISRSIFSEDLPKACFLSLAMRSRRSWINLSCASNVADIFAFSACKAVIIAFRKAGSSGRFWVAFDMSLTIKNQDELP